MSGGQGNLCVFLCGFDLTAKYTYKSTVFGFVFYIYLFLAVLGLRGCVGFSVLEVTRGYSLVVVPGFLITLVSLGAEHRL